MYYTVKQFSENVTQFYDLITRHLFTRSMHEFILAEQSINIWRTFKDFAEGVQYSVDFHMKNAGGFCTDEQHYCRMKDKLIRLLVTLTIS